MSVSAIVFACDGCPVTESAPWREGGVANYLRSLGWTVDTEIGTHYCPKCVKKAPITTGTSS